MNQNPQKSANAENEEKLLQFWRENNIFEKTLEKDAPNGDLVFYDGPPFATGLPHYGHILGGTGKDLIARYKTMQGFRVPRKWGWDTHGLPIESIVEKSLGIKSKKEIEEMGLDVFAREARSKVLGFVTDWKKTVERTARWVDFDGSYKTMDNTFMESVWWALGQINEKGLIYEADRVLPYCPRCQTPLANAEIAMDNSYKDIVDISVYVPMKIKNREDEYFLVWTTTPWTLPGNTALALNPELVYVKVSFENRFYYVGQDLFEKVFKDKDAKIIETLQGSELVGLEYVPLFDYFVHDEVAKNENIWKVYGADFVTAVAGTGIVHIAPSFGEDDAGLAKKYSIPAIKHVAPDGTFISTVAHFAGVSVKPKDNHQATDVEIIKYLAHNHVLFAKEKITHSYPHCYRCETPLLYYGLPSWFIRVQDYKKRMLELNEEINWVPDHLKNGRFQHVLENAPDWNFSRNRFWASPLPIWKSASGKMKFITSIEEMKQFTKKSGNKYFMMRHGESEKNTLKLCTSAIDGPYHLTDLGKEEAKKTAQDLLDKKITKIIASPVIRTRETAEIVADVLGIPQDQVVYDDTIRELGYGEFEGKTKDEYHKWHNENNVGYTTKIPGGESIQDARNRSAEALYRIDQENSNENILIITHGIFIESVPSIINGWGEVETMKTWKEDPQEPGEWSHFDFVPLPHNENYELDLHRPYIDVIKLEIDGEEYSRIPEVIDCWFESGSMPFAQNHYPFERSDWKETNFPADFVVEYIAQTRTWFYYTLLISTILFDKAPFKNVVTTGNLNGDDGQKMSKSKGNYPDPWIVMDKYGADALRMYLMSSALMKGEDGNFDEKAVDELNKKLFNILRNIVSFYDMYAQESADVDPYTSTNVLDQWILALWNKTLGTVVSGLEKYQPLEPARALRDFIGELSTWYIRRSRDRFKSDDAIDRGFALATTKYILQEIAKTMAPFTPFIAEEVWQKFGSSESVHLETYPVAKSFDEAVLVSMSIGRDITSKGLEARQKAGVKVRQPLQSLTISSGYQASLLLGIIEIIKDELNIKEIIFSENISDEVVLDINITEELKNEGEMREISRAIQEMRKNANLMPQDRVVVSLTETEPDWFASVLGDEMMRAVGAEKIVWGSEAKVEKIN